MPGLTWKISWGRERKKKNRECSSNLHIFGGFLYIFCVFFITLKARKARKDDAGMLWHAKVTCDITSANQMRLQVLTYSGLSNPDWLNIKKWVGLLWEWCQPQALFWTGVWTGLHPLSRCSLHRETTTHTSRQTGLSRTSPSSGKPDFLFRNIHFLFDHISA